MTPEEKKIFSRIMSRIGGKGGKKTSDKKAKAARENGKLAWPRKLLMKFWML